MPYLYHKSNSQYIPAHIRIIKTDYVDDRDEVQKTSGKYQALPVYQFTSGGIYIDVHRTKQAVAASLGVHSYCVSRVLDGIGQSVGGYRLSHDRHPVWERRG